MRASVAGDAPEVLVQSVGAGDLAVPLAALLSALLNCGSRGGRGNTQHNSSSSKELHGVEDWKCLSEKESWNEFRRTSMVYKDSTSLTLVREREEEAFKVVGCVREDCLNDTWALLIYEQNLPRSWTDVTEDVINAGCKNVLCSRQFTGHRVSRPTLEP